MELINCEMKTLLCSCILWIGLVIPFNSYSQTFMPAKDASLIRKSIIETSQNTNSIKSNFTQEKNLSMISEKVISKGIFYFKKDERVRLEYLTPFKYLMVINNGKMFIRDDEKSMHMDMHKNKIFKEINNIILNCVKGTVFSSTDFNVSIFENNTQVKLEMLPVAAGLKDFFKSIHVFIDKKDYAVIRIEMNEISGDYTVISFTNKEMNGKVSDDLFAVN